MGYIDDAKHHAVWIFDFSFRRQPMPKVDGMLVQYYFQDYQAQWLGSLPRMPEYWDGVLTMSLVAWLSAALLQGLSSLSKRW